MSKHGAGGNVELRLYMEGRYIPNALTGIQVAGNTGQPATAQLELVPTNTIKHILPGTWIHAFVTDDALQDRVEWHVIDHCVGKAGKHA